MPILTDEVKRNIRECLVYAVSQLKSKTQIHLVIQEFYHSLNRKQLLLNNEVESETAEAQRLVEENAQNWAFVSEP